MSAVKEKKTATFRQRNDEEEDKKKQKERQRTTNTHTYTQLNDFMVEKKKENEISLANASIRFRL